MKKASESEDFREAARIKRIIDAEAKKE